MQRKKVAEAVKAFEGHRSTFEMHDASRYQFPEMLDAFRYPNAGSVPHDVH